MWRLENAAASDGLIQQRASVAEALLVLRQTNVLPNNRPE
jgi:hypothetical protein